jgi:hypothetical protein
MVISQEKMLPFLPKEHLFVPKSLHRNILLPLALQKKKKPAVQANSGDYWFPGPAPCGLSFLLSTNKTSLIFTAQVYAFDIYLYTEKRTHTTPKPQLINHGHWSFI